MNGCTISSIVWYLSVGGPGSEGRGCGDAFLCMGKVLPLDTGRSEVRIEFTMYLKGVAMYSINNVTTFQTT